ncbi:MAG: hypothetical protein HXS41_10715 [Theionarchaea archaeon]|nr:hypothetical protein [Theionarchaea archaeon]MBU7000699.1 hypothetical protein [Theionarchaea archaeon]MBU7021518.1 hypothetical protein [Theionarchaea archaeon]MBU7033542.1 hypothetical protein [Theionarchaea archaeon]MBU7039648.1 hypothetical protein [Theionarchaea archaeon]
MEDKTKVSLLYMLIGGLLGIFSALLSILGVPNTVILFLYVVILYATTYLYPLIGVKLEKLGESRPRSALGGAWSSLLSWLVIWTMVFYAISPVIILAGPDHTEAAQDLGAYLESGGVRVSITDNYSRYLLAREVIVVGSRVTLPVGTNYGATVFPDAIQQLIRSEKPKGTLTSEAIDSGELITINKAGRTIIIISGSEAAVDKIAQEQQKKILDLVQ